MNKDLFTIKDGIVLCHSKSGSTYRLTKTTCTCSGFGFRRTCRHHKEATEQGLFKQLDDILKAKPISLRSKAIISVRRKALSDYLKRKGIKATVIAINTIEPTITVNTKPQNILQWALTFKDA
jgi:hypothetical protein